MQDLIQINGTCYNAAITSLKRSQNVTDSDNAGRTKAPAAEMIRDVIGTFVSYTATFEVGRAADGSEDTTAYDALVLARSQPVDYVPVVMPYGQGTLAFDAYVTKVEDELLLNLGAGKRRWGGLKVTFTPMRPQYRP